MATMALELINPYAKYGLKRRPTYDEIIGLIGENETLTGQLPNRDATQFKASPEGSFFDGLDSFEILKEQQHRIMERQMRELLMRQNLGSNTYSIARLQQQRGENTPPQPETLNEDGMTDAQMQTELQQRATAYANRQQQTGQAHNTFLQRATSLPILSRLMSVTSSPAGTPAQRSNVETPATVQEVDLSREDTPDEDEDEMNTARLTDEDLIANSIRRIHPTATEREVARVLDVLLQYKDLAPEQIATNFSNFAMLNEIFSVLNRNGMISDQVVDRYQAITHKVSDEGGGRKRAKHLAELANFYRRNVYDKYLSSTG